MNTYLTKEQRYLLIEEYIDCYEETGGEDSEGTRAYLNTLSNSALVGVVRDSGWDIV